MEWRRLRSTSGGYSQAVRCKPVRKESKIPQQAWSQKRERQYEHIKDAEKGRGVPEPMAKEIAAYGSGGVTTWLGTD